MVLKSITIAPAETGTAADPDSSPSTGGFQRGAPSAARPHHGASSRRPHRRAYPAPLGGPSTPPSAHRRPGKARPPTRTGRGTCQIPTPHSYIFGSSTTRITLTPPTFPSINKIPWRIDTLTGLPRAHSSFPRHSSPDPTSLSQQTPGNTRENSPLPPSFSASPHQETRSTSPPKKPQCPTQPSTPTCPTPP